jgi:hypothetical protein
MFLITLQARDHLYREQKRWNFQKGNTRLELVTCIVERTEVCTRSRFEEVGHAEDYRRFLEILKGRALIEVLMVTGYFTDLQVSLRSPDLLNDLRNTEYSPLACGKRSQTAHITKGVWRTLFLLDTVRRR